MNIKTLNQSTIEEYRKDDLHYVGQTTPFGKQLILHQSQGTKVWDANGKEYLDFISGIAVNNVGHTNPEVVEAIIEQAKQMLHVNVFGKSLVPVQVDLAKELAKVTPDGLDKIFFTNSGTEAIEGAIKLARRATGKHKIIAFEGAFHGRTCGSLSISYREVYRKPFEPLLPGVTFVPFNDLKAAEQAITPEVGMVIIEPIQGEGGVHVPSDDFLPGLRALCDQNGAMLVLDEIQTGFGRTGKFFACEHWNVVPDILVVAKALGGGMPLGGFISRPEVMNILTDPPLSHMTTFGGHPVSCAAGLASLNIINRDKLVERSAIFGNEIQNRLKEFQKKYPVIVDVRGKGLMIGLEFATPELTKKIVGRAQDLGLILSWSIYAGGTVRVAPPLNVLPEEIDQALNILEKAITESI
ncbi:MAG: aspartate aminotransferase family protein [Chloroflexi bacterium HGW-Chloroflexi-2]|jgi:predicted acetylornithine/succinylornithine family transaminase|nr:MAG: aspartate aminotransferase family protein [Chloroflexi bacterium HGW-Chloroflexi-2]